MRNTRPILAYVLSAAAVQFSAAPCQSQANVDLLIMRDGSQQRGTLEWCSGEVCSLSGKQTAQASILWIGLGGSQPPTPTVRDPARNEIHFIDKTVLSTTNVRLNTNFVMSDQKPHPRTAVTWIHLVTPIRAPSSAQPRSTQPENTPIPLPSYVWQGVIEVENNYNGRSGEHRWTAEYQVKFLEEHTRARRGIISSFIVYSIVPLELKYTIHARQDWDRGAHALHTNAAGKIYGGDVRMHGQATGTISADRMKGYKFLTGYIGALDAPAASANSDQRAFATRAEYNEFFNKHVSSQAGPGWYYVSISFDGSSEEKRALYHGINRTGQQPLFVRDKPAADFIHWIPTAMPGGTNVIGRLGTPDQTEVRGEITYPSRAQQDDPSHIKVKWVFERTRTP